MAYDESLAARIREVFERHRDVEEKKMFGGLGFLLQRHLCVGVWKENLIARVGPDGYEEALERCGAVEFDITGRPMRGWVMVEPEGVEEDESLRQWIVQAIEFVRTLPPK